MQTFLPLPDFEQSARVLDNKRLGKQRVEAYQILRVLRGITRGWRNHPAVRMWRGYDPALRLYLRTVISEWVRRGFRNAIRVRSPKFRPDMPPWFGDPEFHAAHRSNLIRKDPDWYGRFGWEEEPGLPYVWPVNYGTITDAASTHAAPFHHSGEPFAP